MCQGPEQARILPTGTRFTSGAVAWARGRAGWFQLCKEGIGKKDREKKKKKKQARKKKAKCLLSVCLIVSLSASLCLWLSPQCSRARFPVPALPFSAPATPQDDSRPRPRPSCLPQREEGLLPRGPHLRLRGGRCKPVPGVRQALGRGVAQREVLGDT